MEFIVTTESPENRIKFAIEDFIRRNHWESFRLDTHNHKAIELLLNVDRTKNNNITFKPLTTRNRRGNPQILLKRDSKGLLQYNNAKTAMEAVRQFMNLIDEIQYFQEDRDETIRHMPMVDTNVEYTPINGLTEHEKRELEGTLNPPDSIDKSTRSFFRKAQADHFQHTIDRTI